MASTTTRSSRALPLTTDRITSRIAVTADGCWTWNGPLTTSGYGRCSIRFPDGIEKLAHRASYRLHVGPIPDGQHLDHLCRVRPCCNPQHLQPVTCLDNLMRSPVAPAAVNAAKTHCPAGHAYDETNTRVYIYRGRPQRICRACGVARKAAGK